MFRPAGFRRDITRRLAVGIAHVGLSRRDPELAEDHARQRREHRAVFIERDGVFRIAACRRGEGHGKRAVRRRFGLRRGENGAVRVGQDRADHTAGRGGAAEDRLRVLLKQHPVAVDLIELRRAPGARRQGQDGEQQQAGKRQTNRFFHSQSPSRARFFLIVPSFSGSVKNAAGTCCETA